MSNGLLIYAKIFAHFLISQEALPYITPFTRSHLNFLAYEENFLFFFINVLLAPSIEVRELPTAVELMVVGSTDLTLLGWSSVEEPGRLPVEKLGKK
jgi:hypothetical protein